MDEADVMLADLLAKRRAIVLAEQRHPVVAGPHPAEGRRGREYRKVLAMCAPEELPQPRPSAANMRDQTRLSNAANREQVERLVGIAARKADLDTADVGRALGAYFEAVAAELVTGRYVVIPGIGAFCARPSQPHPRRRQRCYIAFTAARNLGVRVCEWAAYNPQEYRRWENFRKNHRPSGRSWRAIAQSPELRVQRAWSRIGRRRKPASTGA